MTIISRRFLKISSVYAKLDSNITFKKNLFKYFDDEERGKKRIVPNIITRRKKIIIVIEK